MKLLNLACGAVRPKEPWINVDSLYGVLKEGTPERANLDAETNYMEWDITQRTPFIDNYFDGILCSHAIEHFDCQTGVSIIRECHRILKPRGILMVSVPDVAVFRENYHQDNPQNAVAIFGEPIHEADGEKTFFGYALWNRYHRAILGEDALWAYFVRAGFRPQSTVRVELEDIRLHREDPQAAKGDPIYDALQSILNRLPFSLIMVGSKATS
jgi:SAM-dependent methyltransferase